MCRTDRGQPSVHDNTSLIGEASAERSGEPDTDEDPLDVLIGSLEVEPGNVDGVIYGANASARTTAARRRRRS